MFWPITTSAVAKPIIFDEFLNESDKMIFSISFTCFYFFTLQMDLILTTSSELLPG